LNQTVPALIARETLCAVDWLWMIGAAGPEISSPNCHVVLHIREEGRLDEEANANSPPSRPKGVRFPFHRG
jgi:hypothetical protein